MRGWQTRSADAVVKARQAQCPRLTAHQKVRYVLVSTALAAIPTDTGKCRKLYAEHLEEQRAVIAEYTRHYDAMQLSVTSSLDASRPAVNA